MTKQDYKNLLIETSKNGGFPAMDKMSGQCLYRTNDGRGCAIGVILPDSLYEKRFEGKEFHEIYSEISDIRWIPDGMDDVDLRSVQRVHDNLSACWNHEAFVQELDKLECLK